MAISLSYLLTTRNKLSYLREIMPALVQACRADEEIIVIDGNSTDGTVDFLEGLFQQGRIHQFVSEPDFCQAHATNKGLLIARGEIIKIITDDDAFSFPVIQTAKRFMVENPELDLLVGDVGDLCPDENGRPFLRLRNEHRQYLLWQENPARSYWFGDQGILIRRKSLPIVGLYHTGVVCIDVEQGLRLTTLKQAKIGWTDGLISVSVLNMDSNGVRHAPRVEADVTRLFDFYMAKSSNSVKNVPATELIRELGRRLEQTFRKRLLGGVLSRPGKRRTNASANILSMPFSECFAAGQEMLMQHQQRQEPRLFLPNNQHARRLLAAPNEITPAARPS